VIEMKKSLAAGLFAVGLIAAGVTGFALTNVKANSQDPAGAMLKGMGNSQMTQMMKSVNTNATQKQNDQSTFEQMLPFMKKMHPNLSDEQLKALYEQMMGPNGACSNGMMGTNGNGNGNGMMGTANNL
jgi:hypothetical protein